MRAFDLAVVAIMPIYYVVIEWVCGSVVGRDRYKELLVELITRVKQAKPKSSREKRFFAK